MTEQADWIAQLQADFAGLWAGFLDYMPDLVAGLLLLLAGWLTAAVLRVVVRRMTQGLGWLLPRLLPGGRRRHGWIGEAAPGAIGELVFWVIMLAFAAAVSQLLGLTRLSEWLDQVLDFLPVLLAGALIVALGLVLGRMARTGVSAAAARAGLAHRDVLGAIAQTGAVVAVAVVALEVLGVDITLFVVAGAIVLGAGGLGLALAFGLGASDQVSNLVSARNLQRRYEVGDRIRIAGVEGRIVELTPRGVVVEAQDGQVFMPARYFNREPCSLLIRERADD